MKRQQRAGEKERRNLKKPYSRPRLTTHGDIAKITFFVGGLATDGKAGSGPPA